MTATAWKLLYEKGADGILKLVCIHLSSKGVMSCSSGLRLSRVLLEAAAFLLLLFCALLLCLRSLLLLMIPSDAERPELQYRSCKIQASVLLL